jgi:carbonic anhydrase
VGIRLFFFGIPGFSPQTEEIMQHFGRWPPFERNGCRSFQGDPPPVSARDGPAESLLIACTDPVLDSSLIPRMRSAPLLIWREPGPVIPPYGVGHGEVERVIEQAVNDAGVKEITVCGHLPAGPLWAQVECDLPTAEPASDPLRYYAQTTRRVVEEKYGLLDPDRLRQALVEENVFVQLANLRTYPAVLARLDTGDLTLHSWLYDTERDELYGYGPSPGALWKRLKVLSRSRGRTPLPSLDPRDIYLA